jgi:hypothetical protein
VADDDIRELNALIADYGRNIVGEDADNTYYEDKYDFHYPTNRRQSDVTR